VENATDEDSCTNSFRTTAAAIAMTIAIRHAMKSTRMTMLLPPAHPRCLHQVARNVSTRAILTPFAAPRGIDGLGRRKIERAQLLDEPWPLPRPDTAPGSLIAEIFHLCGFNVPQLASRRRVASAPHGVEKWPVAGGVTADAAQKLGTARRAAPLVWDEWDGARTMAACAPDRSRRLVVLDRSRQAEKVCCDGGHCGTRRRAAST
jgi:hypothetical protein